MGGSGRVHELVSRPTDRPKDRMMSHRELLSVSAANSSWPSFQETEGELSIYHFQRGFSTSAPSTYWRLGWIILCCVWWGHCEVLCRIPASTQPKASITSLPQCDNQCYCSMFPEKAPVENHWFTVRNVTAKKATCCHCCPRRKMTRTTKLQQKAAGRAGSWSKGNFLEEKTPI